MWLAIALAGYAIMAVVSVLDKFIVSNEKISPLKVTFFTTAPIVVILCLAPFGVARLGSQSDWLIAVIAGAGFVIGMWALNVGLVESEVSHLGPLLGAIIPLFVLMLGQSFLHERITAQEYGAIAILIIGSLIISFERSKLNSGWHRGMAWGIASGFFFAVSHVGSKYLYNRYGFYSGFVWSRAFVGLSGLLLLVYPEVWKSIFGKRQRKNNGSAVGKKSKIAIFLTDKMLSVAGVVLIQYATALGSVAIVNALAGAQYALLILFVILLSRFAPKVFKEEYARGEVMQEIVAVLLIVLGLVVLVI